jgi:winged helix DNA-binding protein
VNSITARRLRAQRLTGKPFASPVDAVRRLGAVQSQDYAGAKWALALRSRATTDTAIDRLFGDGAILRTHVMRPTWHFVLPEDIGWLLDLTARRIRLGLAARYRELGIDDKVAARAAAAFAAALSGGRHLTRNELGHVLSAAGISTEGQRLPHLIMGAELDKVIVSGPRRGKQFTYALFEERAPKARELDRDSALGELSRRYFRSHGPAQMQDFTWWSGLTAAEARKGIEIAGPALEHRVTDGNDYWQDDASTNARSDSPVVHLLPNFDEYTVGYRDRSALIPGGGRFDPSFYSFGSILSNVVTIDGVVRGAWRRSSTRGGLVIEMRFSERLAAREAAAVEEAVRRMARFLGRPVKLALTQG